MCLFHRQHEDTPVIQRIISTMAEGKGMDSLIANTAPAGLVPNDEDTDVDDDACGTGEDAGAKNSARTKKKVADEDEKKTVSDTKKGKAGKSKEWPVHLFCRMEGCEYVYCGRLRAMEYDPRK